MNPPPAEIILGSIAIALLLVAAITDVTTRTIPNSVSLALFALFPAAAFFSPHDVNLVEHGLSFALVFTTTFVLWYKSMLGGGDVKLLSALALWATFDTLGGFILLTTLAGGALAIIFASLRFCFPFLAARLAMPLAAVPEAAVPHGLSETAPIDDQPTTGGSTGDEPSEDEPEAHEIRTDDDHEVEDSQTGEAGSDEARAPVDDVTIPYAVAIAIGGLWLVADFLKLIG